MLFMCDTVKRMDSYDMPHHHRLVSFRFWLVSRLMPCLYTDYQRQKRAERDRKGQKMGEKDEMRDETMEIWCHSEQCNFSLCYSSLISVTLAL